MFCTKHFLLPPCFMITYVSKRGRHSGKRGAQKKYYSFFLTFKHLCRIVFSGPSLRYVLRTIRQLSSLECNALQRTSQDPNVSCPCPPIFLILGNRGFKILCSCSHGIPRDLIEYREIFMDSNGKSRRLGWEFLWVCMTSHSFSHAITLGKWYPLGSRGIPCTPLRWRLP